MLIDFHVHLAIREQLSPSSNEFCDSFWFKDGRGDWNDHVASSEAIDAYLEAEGVDCAVGLAELSYKVTGVTTNEFVYERFAASKKVLMFGSINPHTIPDPRAEVNRLAGMGFRGLKLYPTYHHFYANDPSLYRMYEACAAHRWPVMVHTGSSIFTGAKIKFGDPIFLDDVAVDFPELNILIVHGGRGLWYERAAFLANLHQNLYLEVSGLPPQNLTKYFPNLERIGHKVVFGSDFPGNPGIRHNMDEIRKLPLSQGTIDNILGNTAARLLDLADH